MIGIEIQNYTLIRIIHMYKEPADEEVLGESYEFKKDFKNFERRFTLE